VSEDSLPGKRRVEHIMGLPILVDVRDEHVVAGDFDSVFEWFRAVDATYSTFKEDSVVSRIARGELAAEDAPAEVRYVLARCEELNAETAGYFDAYYAGTLDPSGFVKGWAVDRAAELLEAAGLENFAVNAGGDIRLLGSPVPGPVWRVGIRSPLDAHQVVAVVEGNDLAVATSGAYARGEHVLDPHSAAPPGGILSVTITGPLLATADAYATAAFAMGERAALWTAALDGYEALTIRADRQMLSTPGFPRAGDDRRLISTSQDGPSHGPVVASTLLR
jgi:thiamine biosynthesis lipoprotein